MFNKLKCLLLVFVIGIVSIVGTKSVNALPESISGVNAGSLISYDGGPRLYHKTYGIINKRTQNGLVAQVVRAHA